MGKSDVETFLCLLAASPSAWTLNVLDFPELSMTRIFTCLYPDADNVRHSRRHVWWL